MVKVPQKTLLMDALKEESAIVYDFCMCNPPFFANQLEAKVRLSPALNLLTLSTRLLFESPERVEFKRLELFDVCTCHLVLSD